MNTTEWLAAISDVLTERGTEATPPELVMVIGELIGTIAAASGRTDSATRRGKEHRGSSAMPDTRTTGRRAPTRPPVAASLPARQRFRWVGSRVASGARA